jgi:YegS/Rv2252/BmrU family lipid kinase
MNPHSARGYTLARLPDIIKNLQQLNVEFDLAQTRGPGHATELARQAAVEGYERLVAVGGDGTLHEVANGLLRSGRETTTSLGIIPSGSGNDFAGSLGIPRDPVAASDRLKNGSPRLVDAGLVTTDGASRFFINNVGLGLDAEVTIASTRVRRLRGLPLYLWSALPVIAFGRWPYLLRFSMNGNQYQQVVTLLTVANGTRVGGGFYLTPQAQVDDGLFDICYAAGLSKLETLRLLPRAIKGTHLDHPAVTTARSESIEIVAEGGVPAYVDGEVLCVNGRRFMLKVLPAALQVWV